MSAEEARALAKSNKIKIIDKQKSKVFDLIKTAASGGTSSVKIYYVHVKDSWDIINADLLRLGYKVNMSIGMDMAITTAPDNRIITISW